MKPTRLSCHAALIALLIPGLAAWAQPQGGNPALVPVPGDVQVVARGSEGTATFVTGVNGQPIPVAAATTRSRIEAVDFLVQYGQLFGVADVDRQLVQARVAADDLGVVHTTFEQVHAGIPVFTGVLKVHANSGAAKCSPPTATSA